MCETMACYDVTLQRTNTKTWKKESQKKNCLATVPISTFHVSVSDLYNYTIDLPILLQEIFGPILGIY
jgi:hypothetical protein